MSAASVVLAAACAFLTVSVGLRPRPVRPLGCALPRRSRVVPGAVVLALVTLGSVAAGSSTAVVLGGLGLALAGGGVRLARQARAGREEARTRARVVEFCESVRAELAAGQTAGQALAHACSEWPAAEPAARAAATGGDVPRSLRALADLPGAASFRFVGAAWQVAHRTGHGLGDALGRVADDLRAAEQTRRIVTGELASARATSRLLAALPLVALLLGAGAGGAPWSFLLGHPAGLACLGLGLTLGWAGLAWVEALARDIERRA